MRERWSEVPAKEREREFRKDIWREKKRKIESGDRAEPYDWQLKEAKVGKKMKEGEKTEIFSLPLHSFVLSSCPIHSSHFFPSFPLLPLFRSPGTLQKQRDYAADLSCRTNHI